MPCSTTSLASGEEVKLHYESERPADQRWEAVVELPNLNSWPSDFHAVGATKAEALQRLVLYIEGQRQAKERNMKDKDKGETPSTILRQDCAQAETADFGPSPPDAFIPGYCLRTALAQAEHAAEEMDRRIKEEAGYCAQKLREAGALQYQVDTLKGEHNRLLRHVNQLKMCFTQPR